MIIISKRGFGIDIAGVPDVTQTWSEELAPFVPHSLTFIDCIVFPFVRLLIKKSREKGKLSRGQ